MTHRLRFAPLVALFAAASATAFAAPTDIVPRGDIAYDLLGSLAAAGKLPGYTLRDFSRGDRLYTRREMAIIISRARVSLMREPRNSPHAAAERALAVEFAEELRELRPEVEPTGVPEARSALLTGQFKVRALSEPTQGNAIARVSATIPIGRDGYAAISGGNFREEWYANGDKAYPAIETAFVRLNGRVLDVTIGRMPMRWGPGYAGAMMLSDESPSIPQIQVEKGFKLPGTLGRRVGRLYFTQTYGEFFEADAPTAAPNARGTRRYLATRRLETQSAGRWNASFAETFKSTRLPGPIFSAILPFYLYQNDWTEASRNRWFGFLARGAEPNTFWLNYVGDAQVSYRAGSRGEVLYLDLLLDDTKAPRGIGLGDDTPQRMGYQVGAYAPDLFGLKRYGLRLEYANIDTTTYTNISPPVAWTQDGLPLGHAAGPNASVFFARFDARFSDKVKVALESQTRRRRVTEATSTEPNADRLGIYATYSLKRDLYLGARVERNHVEPVGGPSTTKTRIEGNIGFGF
jgi:hypothetical protein